jgi:hypothetical protein
MKRSYRYAAIAFLPLFAIACSLFGAAATPTPIPTQPELAATDTPTQPPTRTSTATEAPTRTPTPTATRTPTPTVTATSTTMATSVPCELTASGNITLYNRPDTQAQVFSTVGSGFQQWLIALSPDGWYGFDPAYAQAANIGPFRLRWVPPTGSYSLSGNCEALPVLEWVPPPGLCFTMPMIDTNVYENPDTAAAVITTLTPGQFAEVTGVTSDHNWAQVDLGPGNTGLSDTGWVEGISLNFNGPTCGSLPIVTP